MQMPALSIVDLHKTYSGGVNALKGISLQVETGAFFALLGPNGAGKTTAISIITSLVTKSAGTVKIFGVDIDRDFSAAKKLIGVVPQEFNFSIFEKVQDIVTQQAGYYGIPRQIALQRAKKYLKKLELWGKRHVAARELSGGMKRRLMIARGLVHEPRLLILDEPTAGVDVELRRGMWDFLEELSKEGITIILTTHYLEEAEQLCDRIAIINRGRIIENTDMHTLLRKLNAETYVFETREPVASILPLENVDFTPLPNNGITVLKRKSQPLSTVINHLADQGIIVETLRHKTNRLEALYMEMVEK